MAINFDNALGIHPQALMLREKRAELLASNLANADTPNYKARDLDFKTLLERAENGGPQMLENTRPGHIASNGPLGANLMYRVPQLPSLDGNTVESHIEQSEYAQNAVQYQASLRFINGKLSGLMTAIRGE